MPLCHHPRMAGMILSWVQPTDGEGPKRRDIEEHNLGHDEIQLAIVRFVDLEDSANVGVVQRRAG